jgi:hypothetical protein
MRRPCSNLLYLSLLAACLRGVRPGFSLASFLPGARTWMQAPCKFLLAFAYFRESTSLADNYSSYRKDRNVTRIIEQY